MALVSDGMHTTRPDDVNEAQPEQDGSFRALAAHRRRQWRAIAGALLLVGWNGVPMERAATPSEEPGFTAQAATVRQLQREGIIAKLKERNSTLGEGRASRIADAVLRCTDSQKLSDLTPRLMLSVMFQESNARPYAISPKGAIGLMQVMPYTYERLDLPGGIANLESNIEAGCLVLADNIKRLGREKGISSYFWGAHIRGDDYLNGVETIFRTLSVDTNAAVTEEGRG